MSTTSEQVNPFRRNALSDVRMKARSLEAKKMTFGERLRAARDTTGLNQRDLATLCGWTGDAGQVRISAYESDTNEPALADIERLAMALGVPAAELAFGYSADFTKEELALVQAWRTGDPVIKTMLSNVVKMWKKPRWRRGIPPSTEEP